MKSSIPDHGLDTAIWRLTAAQHFAYFQRQLRSLGVSDQHYTLHRLRGGGATDHWLQCRDLPPLRRRGRWTSARTLERYLPLQPNGPQTSAAPIIFFLPFCPARSGGPIINYLRCPSVCQPVCLSVCLFLYFYMCMKIYRNMYRYWSWPP